MSGQLEWNRRVASKQVARCDLVIASFLVRIRVRVVRQLSVDEVSQGARVVRKVEIDGQLAKVLEVD